MSPFRLFPPGFKIGDVAGNEKKVERSAASHLIGDAYITALRIADFRHVHGRRSDSLAGHTAGPSTQRNRQLLGHRDGPVGEQSWRHEVESKSPLESHGRGRAGTPRGT